MERTTAGKCARETLPTCFIPWASNESPTDPKKMTPARTKYLRNVTLQAPIGCVAVVEFSCLRLSLTHLLRLARSFRKLLASLYRRLRSPLSNMDLRRIRYTALGRK